MTGVLRNPFLFKGLAVPTMKSKERSDVPGPDYSPDPNSLILACFAAGVSKKESSQNDRTSVVLPTTSMVCKDSYSYSNRLGHGRGVFIIHYYGEGISKSRLFDLSLGVNNDRRRESLPMENDCVGSFDAGTDARRLARHRNQSRRFRTTHLIRLQISRTPPRDRHFAPIYFTNLLSGYACQSSS